MFEGLAESLLKSILGEYVEDLDAQSLSISVWSGHVQLRDLRLKHNLFRKFNLPFDLKLGIIKSLVLEVPWARLARSPVVCKIDQIYLVFSPQKASEWQMQDDTNFEFKAPKIKEYLQRQIAKAALEISTRLTAELELGTNGGSAKSKQAQKQAGMFERYIMRIKDNIQVSVTNVHIRLEDQVDGEDMSVGVTLQELSMRTGVSPDVKLKDTSDQSLLSDDEDLDKQQEYLEQRSKMKTTFFDRTLKENLGMPILKEFRVQGFAIYIDSGPEARLISVEPAKKLSSIAEIAFIEVDGRLIDNSNPAQKKESGTINSEPASLVSKMMEINRLVTQEPATIKGFANFVVKPQTIRGVLIQQSTEKHGERVPYIALHIEIEHFQIELLKSQYECIFRLAEYVRQYKLKHESFNRHRKYKFLRPIYPLGLVIASNEMPVEKGKEIKDEHVLPQAGYNMDLEVSDLNLDNALIRLDKPDMKSERVSSTNAVARAWWQYAITCVIKDNRQKATGKFNQFQISQEHNSKIYRAFRFLLLKTMQTQKPDETKTQLKEKQPQTVIETTTIETTNLQKWERLLLVYCVEAVQLKDLEKWIKVIARDKVEIDERNKQDSQRLDTLADESVLDASFASVQDKSIKVASSVKQGYGASIMQYITLWGSNDSNQTQLKAAEEAVEAVTLAEAQQEKSFAYNSVQSPSLISQGKGNLEESELYASAIANPLEESKQLINLKMPVIENTFKFQMRCILKQATVQIKEICSRQSLLLYFKTVASDFQVRNESQLLRVRNAECGVDHFFGEEVKPLIEVKSTTEQEGTRSIAWRFNLLIKGTYQKAEEDNVIDLEDLEPFLNIESHNSKESAVDPQGQMQYESRFHTGDLRVHYKADVLKSLSTFFQPDQADALRAEALDKLAKLSEQSQSNMKELIQSKRMSKIDFQVDKIQIEIPFKAHNSKFVGEQEEDRERLWSVAVKNFHLSSVQSTLNDIYEKFAIEIEDARMKYKKRSMPHSLEVVEKLKIGLLISLKSKLKQMLASDQNQELVLPEIKVTTLDRGYLPNLVINLTPDAYNAMINIYSVLSPEATRAEVAKQFQEKKGILQAAKFKRMMLTQGVRENLITHSWQPFQVVFSDSYLYFFKDEHSALTPFHYIYVLSIIQMTPIYQIRALEESEDVVLLIKVRNGDQLTLNFGRRNYSSKDLENSRLNIITLISEKQQELRGPDEGEGNIAAPHKENVDLKSLHTGFQLILKAQKAKIRIFRDQDSLFKNQNVSYKEPGLVWSELHAHELGFEVNNRAYDVKIDVTMGRFLIRESYKLYKEVLIVPEPSKVNIVVQSLNSPTITDSNIEIQVKLGGKLLLLFDPEFFNLLIKFIRNTADQSSEDARQILKDLEEQDKLIASLDKKQKQGNQLFLSQEEAIDESKMYITPQFNGANAKERVINDGDQEISDSNSVSGGVGENSDQDDQDSTGFDQETCQTVKIILIKTHVELTKGITVICLHHAFTLAPFMELKMEKFSFRHHMMQDHDVLEGDFSKLTVNDLSMWPVTKHPQTFQHEAELVVEQLKGKKLGKPNWNSLTVYSQQLPFRAILCDNNLEKPSEMKLHTVIHYDNCPLKLPGKGVSCSVEIKNVKLRFYQEQFMRLISYFTNRFLWALTDSQPYPTTESKKQCLTEEEVNNLQDLEQLALDLDLHIQILTSSVEVTERPYLQEQTLRLQVDKIDITQSEKEVTGKHANIPELPMRLTSMLFLIENVRLFHLKDDSAPQAISNYFEVQFTLMYPNYSDLLEKISSKLLDKSSEITVKLFPQISLEMSQELYTYIMRCQALNFSFTDGFIQDMDFSQVNEIFQSSEGLLFMRTKIEVEKGLYLKLIQDNENFLDLTLKCVEHKQNKSSEVVRVDQLLDGSMKVSVQVQIPTILKFMKNNQKRLILGNESDPRSGSLVREATADTDHHEPKKVRAGKLQLRINWNAKGEQQIKCNIDKAKVYIEPECFLRLGHFFSYGLPEFNDTDKDRPNAYETDPEKLPAQNWEFAIVDSMVCAEAFEFENTNIFDQEGESLKTLVCKAQQIVYVCVTDQITNVKEQLAQKLTDFINRMKYQQEQIIQKENEIFEKDHQKQTVEAGRQKFFKMTLTVRELAPFLCDTVDFEKHGFAAIPKRQLISPFELNYSLRKLLSVSTGKFGNFKVQHRNELDMGKTLLKVTFSDVLVIQQASALLVRSQKKYETYLVTYLANHKREQVLKQQREFLSQNKQDQIKRMKSFANISRGGRSRVYSMIFESALQNVDSGEDSQDEEAELLKHEASQVTRNMGSQFIGFMTGTFTAAVKPQLNLQSLKPDRNESEFEFYDAESDFGSVSRSNTMARILRAQSDESNTAIKEAEQKREDDQEEEQIDSRASSTVIAHKDSVNSDPFKNSRGQSLQISYSKNSEDTLIDWKVDYGDPQNFSSIPSKTTANLAGVHVMVINDHKNVFYPIMQIHVDELTFALENAESLRGDTDIKLLISYFNMRVDAWEPFLERTHIRLSIESDDREQRVQASFRTPLNINLSEELFETVVPAYLAFQKSQGSEPSPEEESKKEEEKVTSIRAKASRGVVNQPHNKNLESKQRSSIINLEQKVAPYRIVNLTSKKIQIRRREVETVVGNKDSSRLGEQSKNNRTQKSSSRFQNNLANHPIVQQSKQDKLESGAHSQVRQRSQLVNSYFINSGGNADYEVDDEQEAQQLIKNQKDDLVRKQDFIDIIFGEGKSERDKIRAFNLANSKLHQHSFSNEQFDFIVFGMSANASKHRKTFLLRSPFIVFNKTDCTFMLKIVKHQTSEEKFVKIEPGEGYPLSQSELRAKLMLSSAEDYFASLQDPESLRQEDVWSSHFKVSNFFQKQGISRKKFFVYHARKFSMVFLRPADFFPAWDLCIEVPVVVRNTLPFGLRVRTFLVRKYFQPRSMLLSSQAKKEIVPEKTPTEFLIPKQGKMSFFNFNLDEEVRFEVALDAGREPVWALFVLPRGEYKSNLKTIVLEEASGLTLEVTAQIKATEQTDLELTFFCQHCLVNNTGEQVIVWSQDGKTKLPWLSANSPISILPSKASKVVATIAEDSNLIQVPSQKQVKYQSLQVGVVGVSSQLTLMKGKDSFLECVLNTTWSRVSATDHMVCSVTSIHPQYVICNQTSMILMVCQTGFHDKVVEVIPQSGRLPLYWNDQKGQPTIQFKLAQGAEGLNDNYEWSKPIRPMQIGRVSIRCKSKIGYMDCEHVLVIKQVDQATQTIFVSFQIENQAKPTYKFENLSQGIWLEYFQVGVSDTKETLAPGKTTCFSWIDPEKAKGKKAMLCCNLELFDSRENKLVPLQKLEIELDSAEFSRTFVGRFIEDDFSSSTRRRTTFRKAKGQEIENEALTKLVKIEVVTQGFTKILRLTEKENKKAHTNQISSLDDKEMFPARSSTKKVQMVGDASRLESFIEQVEEDEIEKVHQQISKFQVFIGAMHISFISRGFDRIRREFLLTYFESVEFLAVENDEAMDLQLRVEYVQVDKNAISDSKHGFPAVMFPKHIISRSLHQQLTAEGRARKDFFNAHVAFKQNQDSIFVDKFEFLIQSAVLQIDDELLAWVSKFAGSVSKSMGTTNAMVHPIFKLKKLQKFLDEEITFQPFTVQASKKAIYLTTAFRRKEEIDKLQALIASDSWLNYDVSAVANPVFIRELRMSPIDIELSFRTRVKKEGAAQPEDSGSILRGVKQLGLSLSNVDKAPFRLNSLVISNVFGTPGEIGTVLSAHYRQRMINNVLRLFLSTAALGNMNLLAQDLGTGVKDFFYKPIEGFVDGPIEGGKGLVIGTASLLGHTAKGALGSVSRLMNTVSKSLLFLAGDEDYIDYREQDALQSRPDNVLKGLASGLKSTVNGVKSGVQGIYQQPVKGARKSGVKGFVTGTLKGLGGAVVKPLSGGIDFFAKTSEGAHNMVRVGGRARNQADTEDQEEAKHNGIAQVRAPRPFYGTSQRLKPYHVWHAQIALFLQSHERSEFSSDHLLDAICYASDGVMLSIILTEERMLIVEANEKQIITEMLTENLVCIEARSLPNLVDPSQMNHELAIKVIDVTPEEQEEHIPGSGSSLSDLDNLSFNGVIQPKEKKKGPIIDGFVLKVSSADRLMKFQSRLSNHIWQVKI